MAAPAIGRRRAAAIPWLVMTAAVACAMPAGTANAQYGPEERLKQGYVSGSPDRPSADWILAYGGRLYDNWWVTLNVDPPAETHPAYPAGGAMRGAESWRCVACHGWDYRGKDGAFSTGPYSTGIRGISASAGAPPRTIAGVLRAPPHGYTRQMIPDQALERLARFVSAGQHDIGRYLAGSTGRSRGNAARGRAIFQNACANCHEFDGRAQISGEATGLATIGAVAIRNPAQALHKLRNGQPSADMPAMRVFPDSLIADLLAYLRTLPPR